MLPLAEKLHPASLSLLSSLKDPAIFLMIHCFPEQDLRYSSVCFSSASRPTRAQICAQEFATSAPTASFSEQLWVYCPSFSPDSCVSKFLLFPSSVVLCNFHVCEVHSGFLHLFISFCVTNSLCPCINPSVKWASYQSLLRQNSVGDQRNVRVSTFGKQQQKRCSCEKM